MPHVDVKLVARLRKRTGAPVMECRSALAEAGGDVDEAEAILRRRGVAVVPRPIRTLPPQRWVDCPCPGGLARPVLEEPSGHDFVLSACLRCGRVEAVRVMTDEPHRGHVVPMGNRVLDLSRATRSWVGEWPRRVGTGWERYAYLPASMRCRTPEELTAREGRALEQQAGLDLEARLRHAGLPDSPPPTEPQPPYVLHLLYTAREALALSSDPTPDRARRVMDLFRRYEGLRVAPSGTTAFRILAPHLVRSGVLLTDLAHDDPSRRERAVELLGRLRTVEVEGPPPAAVLPPLLQWLDGLGPEDSRAVHAVLDVLLALGPRAAAAAGALRELRGRCGRGSGPSPGTDTDPYLERRIVQVLGAVTGR